jgi:signal transduction histidine kinase
LQAALAEVARLRAELNELSERRSQFISLVCHELRVPLTSIKGYSDLLWSQKVGPLTARQGEFMERIRRNADRMAVLLSDLSELNRLECGRLALETAPCALEPLLRQAADGLAEQFVERGQSFELTAEPALPDVRACAWAVVEVTHRLLHNAGLYTPEGGRIALHAERENDAVLVEIRDTGIGLSAADQARLFTPFFRADDPLVRQHPGWGLGLAIAWRLLEGQGGRIACESSLGAGSVFRFTLPPAG